MTVHPTEQLYKTRMAEAQALEGAEAEYHSLEQGPYGTDLRHKAIVDFVQGLDGEVIDLGCGNGMILDPMVKRGIKPRHYWGIDGMLERHLPLVRRLQKYEIQGRFTHKGMDQRFEDLVYPFCDAALLVGVMGFYGHHTNRQVSSIYAKMRGFADHGAITFPMIWDPNQMGDLYLRRWDPTDIQDLLQLHPNKIVRLEREFVIYW